jgi:hypothetical protein
MSISLCGARVNDSGNIIFDPAPGLARQLFFDAVYETPEGEEFRKYRNDRSIARVVEIVERWYPEHPGREITVPMFVAVLKSLLDTKDPAVVPPEIVEPEPELPRDNNGKSLTDAQIKWAEYTRFSNESSMSEVNARKQNDAGFASFVRTNMERQIAQPIDGAAVNLLQRERQEHKPANQELQDFVLAYNTMSVEQVRKLGRADTNPLGFQKFHTLFELAVQTGLI